MVEWSVKFVMAWWVRPGRVEEVGATKCVEGRRWLSPVRLERGPFQVAWVAVRRVSPGEGYQTVEAMLRRGRKPWVLVGVFC